MSTFLQQLINGISLGAIYALIALGYTMVYGILRLINFAHGDVYMVGAFMGYYLAGGIGIRGAQMLMGNPDANIFPADRSDHRDRGFAPAREWRPGSLWRGPKVLSRVI